MIGCCIMGYGKNTPIHSKLTAAMKLANPILKKKLNKRMQDLKNEKSYAYLFALSTIYCIKTGQPFP